MPLNLGIVQGLAGDVRFSARTLRHHPAYAAASVLTLALGIGATSAVVAIVDATLVRPLPYRQPDRLVAVGVLAKGPDGSATPFGPSQMELIRWHDATRSFEAIEAVEPRTLALTGGGDPELVKGAAVSSGLFAMLGTEPLLGRTFSAAEERSDVPVAVVSEGLARRRFADAPAVGRTPAARRPRVRDCRGDAGRLRPAARRLGCVGPAARDH